MQAYLFRSLWDVIPMSKNGYLLRAERVEARVAPRQKGALQVGRSKCKTVRGH